MKKILLSVIALIVTFSMGITSVFAADDSILVSPYSDITYKNPDKETIELGDEICIGEECFYVLNSNDSKTILIAKYNLLVGKKVVATLVDDAVSYDSSDLGAEETKFQDEKAKGAADEDNEEGTFYGTVAFDEEKIGNYLADYERYFEDNYEFLGAVDVRLANADDVHYIGCDRGETCEDVPAWAKNTTYWIDVPGFGPGTAITRSTSVATSRVGYPVTADGLAGIRPVFDVTTSIIKRNKVTINPEDGTLSEEDGKTKITPATKERYEVDKVTAKTSDGTEVTVTEKDGVYYINNSDVTDDVTVTITYKEKEVTSNVTSTSNSNKEVKAATEENPDTSDNAGMIFMLCLCSIVGMVFASRYLRESYKA